MVKKVEQCLSKEKKTKLGFKGRQVFVRRKKQRPKRKLGDEKGGNRTKGKKQLFQKLRNIVILNKGE